MHLLALADTVSTCDADFAERFAANARIDISQGTGQEVVPGKLTILSFISLSAASYA